MGLLLDIDYEFLATTGLEFEEDVDNRYLIIKNYPLPEGIYGTDKAILTEVEILIVIPPNYNTSGTDMLWTYPLLLRADGKPIPNTSANGGADPRYYQGKEFCRWSRHYSPDSWKPKVDNVQKILSRIEWALQNPDANK